MKQYWVAAMALTAVLANSTQAGEAEVRKGMQDLAPGAKIVQLKKAPLPGWYEVVIENQQGQVILYVADKGQYAFSGDLIDISHQRNLTEERKEELNKVSFNSLPLEQALKIVKGNGQRKLVVFSDPDCPYCRKLETELAKIDNVTIYNFIYPIAHPKATAKARQIWCSKDRARAWNDYMLNQKLVEGSGSCANFLDENMALGHRLHVEGTPTLIFTSGKRVPGYITADRIEALLK